MFTFLCFFPLVPFWEVSRVFIVDIYVTCILWDGWGCQGIYVRIFGFGFWLFFFFFLLRERETDMSRGGGRGLV
jgi:hypothetical protein